MKPRVLFITEHGDSASSLYRSIVPAKGLRVLGYTVDVSHVLIQRSDRQLTGLNKHVRFIRSPDVIVARRMNGPDGKYLACKDMILDARTHGQRVFFDLDDDPWNLPAHNPAHGSMSPSELEAWQTDMEVCNGVIVATDALRSAVLMNTNVKDCFVCRSGIDAAAYPVTARTEREPLRLGWLGTVDYRGRDLYSIADPLRAALENCGDSVQFWHLGSLQNEPVMVADILSPFPVPIVTRPWVTISDLPRSLAEIDVAVLPMEPGDFNESRSVTTGMALMASGVPFVVTSTAEYRRLWRMGGGYVVNTQAEWYEALKMLTQKPYEQFRRDMRVAGYQLAREMFSPVNVARQYRAVFDE